MKWLKSPYIYTLLALLAFGCLWYAQRTTTLEDIANQISENLENEIDKVTELGSSSNSVSSSFPEYTSLFFFKQDTLVKWSNHTIPVTYNLVEGAIQWKLVRNKSFSYLVKSVTVGDTTQAKVFVLQRNYPIQNKYVKVEWNKRVFPKRNYTLLDANANLGLPVYVNGQCIFRISTQDFSLPQKNLLITVGFSLLLLSLTILVILLNGILTARATLVYTIGFILFLLIIRVCLYFFFLEAGFTDHFLFSPETFASSTLNPSLADLFLNIVFLLYLSLVASTFDFTFLIPSSKYKYSGKDFLIGFILATLIFVIFYFPVALLQTITHNSAEDFSLSTSIRLNTVRILAISAWLGCAFISLLWFLKVWKLFQTFSIHKQRLLLAGATAFSLINISNGETYLNIVVPVWIFLIIIDWKNLQFMSSQFDFNQFIFLFLFSIVVAFSSAIAIQNLDKEREVKVIESYAEELQNERDIFTEYLLQNVANEIQQDIFIQTRLNSPLLSKEPILSKINETYLSGYLSRYKKEIHLYGADGNSFTQVIPLSEVLARYDSLRYGFDKQNYYIRKSGSLINGLHYWVVIPVMRNQSISGYISISLSSLPSGIATGGYPEVWIDERWSTLPIRNSIAYAIVEDKHIVTTIGNFNTNHFLQKESAGIFSSDYSYLFYPWNNNQQLVFQLVNGGYKRVCMDTCYLVVALLFLIILYLVISFILQKEMRNIVSYSTAIQFIINLAFLIPLVIISVYVLYILDRNSKEQFANENESRLVILADQFKGLSKDSLQTSALNIFNKSNAFNEYFDLFSDQGVLLFSNKPLLRSNLLPQVVKDGLKVSNTVISYSEKIGTFSYQELYTRIPESNLILSTPVYQSATAVSILQSQVLNSVIPVFLFVFCLLLWISTLVSAWLIKPFSLFQKSFANTNLDSLNKSLSWSKQDEVALVVNAFNNMLRKLEESKRNLELLKREETWREVAQQVAHEIKNPLTPMKLSLQRMMRNINETDTTNRKTLEMLVEQVDVLDTIASSFSNYAKMPIAHNGLVNLKSLVEKQLSLFSDQLRYRLVSDDIVMIRADEKMLIAVLNNLFLNAIQAAEESKITEVIVEINQIEDKVLLQLADNGSGIPSQLQSKLFQPHFTTKSKGSGLGLAFSFKMMEAMKGKISLAHSDENGTVFLLEFIKADDDPQG
ncbi:MAG: HAMP domain-containing histidine kinase [Cyclobacteriaceae bacterium]|jgi:signal transduction histidine kinase|nr:HAMP domain-containing histidine kinase [Cyclobacteriaceae bacterium]